MTIEISGAALSRELDCSPASITNLVKKRTISLLPSGKLDRNKTLKVIAETTSGSGGGWGNGMRGGKLPLRERAEKLLAASPKKGRGKSDKAPRTAPVDPIGYAHAAGMAFLCEQLREQGRIEALRDAVVELGIEAKPALEAVRLFVVTAHWWIEDRIKAHMGKAALQEFDNDLRAWIESWATEAR
jgi:hypothetical protein